MNLTNQIHEKFARFLLLPFFKIIYILLNSIYDN